MIRLVFCLCSIVNLDSHIEEDFLNYKNQEWHKTNIDTKLCNGKLRKECNLLEMSVG